MIVYLDTSSLVKLYVAEEDSAKVKNLVSLSNATATSLVAYAEARAAFARIYNEKGFESSDYRRLIAFFKEDWDNYLIIRVTKELVRLAGDLAEKYALRGFDAIHLSSAVTLRQELNAPIVFSCADRKLQKASQFENLSQPD